MRSFSTVFIGNPSCFSNHNVQLIIGNAGFRPGGRATFVSAKVAKTIDAQSGHIGWDGRQRERANSLGSNKARKIKEPPSPVPASRRQTSEEGVSDLRQSLAWQPHKYIKSLLDPKTYYP